MSAHLASVSTSLEPKSAITGPAQILQLLRRSLWLILACALTLGIAVFLYAHSLPKIYTANALITVEGDRFAIPELQGALRSDEAPDPMPFVLTEVQALTSRALVSQVVDELHLDNLPEFNADLREPTLFERVKALSGDLIARLLPAPPAGTNVLHTKEAVVGSVTKAIDVFHDNRSLVISVSFASQDPRLSARVVNTLIKDYVALRAGHRADANQGADVVMTQRVGQARADLADIERQMHDLRSKGNVIGLRAGSIGQQQVEQLTAAAAQATLARSQLELNYDRAVAAQKDGSADALEAVLNSPTVSHLRDEQAQAAQALAAMSARFGPNYPGIRSAQVTLDSSRRQITEEASRIVGSLGAQLRIATAQEADIHQQLEQARNGAIQAENAKAELDQLQEEATTRRQVYQNLLERLQQTAGQPAAADTPDVLLLSPAVPPAFPSGPHVLLASLLGGSGGALLGCLMALRRNGAMQGFKTAAEVTAGTGLFVLTTLPRRLLKERRNGQDRGSSANDAERSAMRALRNNLRFSGRREAPRCIMFVPEVAMAGVPLAATFARAAAADGDRVLLIEGNLQTPQLQRYFPKLVSRGTTSPSLASSNGLSDILNGAKWYDAITVGSQAGLDLLLSTNPTSDPSALLNSIAFQNLIVEVRGEYDLVVVNSPPAHNPAAVTLALRVDLAILVIDGRRASQASARSALEALGAAKRTPLAATFLQDA